MSTNVFYNEGVGTTSALGGSATFTGTAHDIGVISGAPGQTQSYFKAYFISDQTGTAYIDVSNDGTTWTVGATSAISVATPVILSVAALTKYHRARVVNGSTTQTYLWVNSGYTLA